MLFRVLFFRATGDELRGLNNHHLHLGLFLTWIAGMGRWWDDPQANWAQHLGLGSVIYVFVLAAVIYIVIKPMGCPLLSYRNLLTYITLTSPPAILYAFPIERYTDLSTANIVNFWFLLIVAAWRVILYGCYLWKCLDLDFGRAIISLLLPLAAIVTTLYILNLHHVVFQFMRGIRETDQTAHDAAYMLLMNLTMLSVLASPFLGAAWLGTALNNLLARK
ncbi:hypothetical protein QQ056_16975 [Oscillatoria laete-virens NRMC-F 0139]|nr:hypothetical protein [Oscillatoria laete-virens]MDL5055226.1 hypothetical protein [Oscillatoria laete-virens NRMC-F 0139]